MNRVSVRYLMRDAPGGRCRSRCAHGVSDAHLCEASDACLRRYGAGVATVWVVSLAPVVSLEPVVTV